LPRNPDPENKVFLRLKELCDGEELLGYTNGTVLTHGSRYSKEKIRVGLTSRYLILDVDGENGNASTIKLAVEKIVRLNYGGGAITSMQTGLHIHFLHDVLTIKITGAWDKPTRQLVTCFKALPKLDLPTSTLNISEIRFLYDLGMITAPLSQMKIRMEEGFLQQMDSDTELLMNRITSHKTSLRLAAWFWILLLVLNILGALSAGTGINVVSLILYGAIAWMLWETQTNIVPTVILMTVLYSGISFIGMLNMGTSMIGSIEIISFLVANLILLVGKSTRTKNILASTIFGLGYLTPAFVYLLILLSNRF